MTPAQRRRRDRRRKAAELRATGFSLRSIAAVLGVSYETVRRYLASEEASHSGVTNVTDSVTNVTAKRDSSNVIRMKRRRDEGVA
jgi:predicted transcriptional regulator